MTMKEPPNGVGYPSTNAHASANKHTAAYPGAQSWTAIEQDASRAQEKELSRVYPHIEDLKTEVQKRLQMFVTAMPVRTLLGQAQSSVNRVHTDSAYKRLHLAFVEYLVSSEILLNLIPRHKDYPSIKTDHGQYGQLYITLCRQNDEQNGIFKEIKKAIMDDNAKNGTRPTSESSSSRLANGAQQHADHNARRDSLPDSRARKQSTQDELFLNQTTHSSQLQPHAQPVQAISHSKLDSSPHRERPPVHSKPDNLHSRPISRNGNTQNAQGDMLSQRFAQLRIAQKTPQPGQNGESHTSNVYHTEMPSPSDYTSSSEASSIIRTSSLTSSGETDLLSKPSGPRAMPLPPKVPPPPPKIPLNQATSIELPRAPAPAYDPAKSILTPINTSVPPLNRMANFGAKEQPPATRPLESSYLSNGTTQSLRPPNSFSKSQARQTSITAAEFYEKLRTTSVLVIDVRSRGSYDEGHVHAKSILCIEPVCLTSGMAAEDLEDRLVVSPEAEQSLFEKRNDFDLVVYYDQSTKSDRFLRGAPTRTEANSLRALHDTLYEFDDYKPLQRPPVVLAGGLDAWIDLVGPQALATSRTAGLIGSTASRKGDRKPARPLGRVPMASANSSLEVRKRRLREQNTLSPDEEKKWLEKAKNEEVNPADYQNAQIDEEGGEDCLPSPFTHSYEDFLRKFPEPSMIQQSMMMATPPPVPPPPPPSRIPPIKPSSPPPLPSIPSRPAPAAPRPSYSGVSEQLSQFSPSARQTSSTQYPLFTPRSSSRYLKLPSTGLINFGVTCYMNATIQCLLATIPLSQLFLDNRWRDYLQKNWKGSNGILPGVFANLIRSLWCDDVTAIRPNSMRALCASLKKEWGADRQQDAKEFFDFVVDCLHEDLNVHWDRNPLRPLTTKEEMQREHMPVRQVSEIEWQRYSHREQSPISDYFAGQHASRLRCTTCHNTSTTYEAFYSISVEIPRSNRKQGWDIHDCLRSYTQEERLSKDEMWKCPFCKCEREATKQITITRAPLYLVVHFKRFEMRKGEYSAKKVHTPIHFPLFGLDLGPYTLPPPTPQEQQQQQSHGYQPELATSAPYLYDAYAVMRHLGSTGNGGHYISLVRDVSRQCWRKFDDDHATDFDPAKLKAGDRLQNEQAYILFYSRAPAR